MGRLLGIRMLGVRGGTLVVCVLALLGGSVNGSAQNGGSPPDLSPPFALGYRTETSSLMAPCQEVPNPPEDGSPSEPEAGQIGIGTAAEAQECTSLAHDVSEVWDLGLAPDALVGQPAHLTVVFVPESFRWDGQGDATVGGSVSLSVGGSEEWALRSFECSAGSCGTDGPEAPDDQLVLEGTVRTLPAQIEAQFRAEAFVTDGTGKANISVTGRLVSVTFATVEAGG